jgi:hypothetical protein
MSTATGMPKARDPECCQTEHFANVPIVDIPYLNPVFRVRLQRSGASRMVECRSLRCSRRLTIDGAMDHRPAAPEQRCDLSQRLAVHVHPDSLSALVRRQRVLAAGVNAAFLRICHSGSDTLADQFALELGDLCHHAEHESASRCLQIDPQRGDDDVYPARPGPSPSVARPTWIGRAGRLSIPPACHQPSGAPATRYRAAGRCQPSLMPSPD